MTGILRSIDHVQLAMPAGQESLARTFCVHVLGLDEVPKPPELANRGGAWFRTGSVCLHYGVEPEFTPSKKAHPAFRCGNYHELLEHVHRHGITIVPDENLFEGKAHCYIFDPFGNRIEIISD